MSLILDALRRAERARDKDLTRRVSEAGAPRLQRGRRSWAPVVILGLAVAIVAVLLWPRPAPDPAGSAEEAADVAAAHQPTPQPAIAPSARGSSLADITISEPSAGTSPPLRPQTPMLAELSATQRATIPAISVDAHFWSEDPARRFVILDMRRLRAGEEARPGLRVVAIDADSVELDWQGMRFRLPAR